MYRLATLMTLFVMLLAGCGGSGDDDSSSSPSAVADNPGDLAESQDASDRESSAAKSAREGEGEGSTRADARGRSNDTGEDSDSHTDADEAFDAFDPAQKRDLITAVVRASLLRFGLKLARIEFADGYRKLTVYITRRSACRAVASQEPSIVTLIRTSAPRVRTVRFEVEGTGQALGYYVLGCKMPEMPDGPGKQVFEHTGVGGPYYSKKFEIRTKRWALEWQNLGASLAVLVKAVGGESKGGTFKPVGSTKPEAGRFEYTGAGVFEITAYGAGRWTVRAKEMR
jgi:hypothetical protein